MVNYTQDVALASKGDTDAFSRLYSSVYKDLYHIALYCLGNSHDACDTVSETVIEAFCSIGKLRKPESFKSWIMRILSVKIKRHLSFKSNYCSETDIPESLDFSYDFDYLSVELKEALREFDSQSRMILSLSVLGGYTSDEIAEICSMNSATVRSKLSRIKQKLKMKLE